MLALASFASIYAVAVSKHGANIGSAAIPNISFAVALLLYVILKIDTKATRRTRQSNTGSVFSRFANGLSRYGNNPEPAGKDRLP